MKAGGGWGRLLVSLVLAAAVWLIFSWPLPRHVLEGIPSSSFNVEKGSVRSMISGDHLQFLYQFWLAEDTLKGKTPPFHNLYEFNFGNDEARTFRGTYYVPFSLFYAAGSAVGGRAFGYNVAQGVTLWLALLFTWLLVRRYCRDEWMSATAAVVGIILPYQWIMLLDGSPTGLAMMLVPMIYWGLDVMVAERRMWGGAVAGLGLLLAESDTHVLFFSLLSAPFWCLFSYLFHFPGRWPTRADVLSTLRASILLLAFLAVTGFLVWHIRHGIQETTLAAAGRSPTEVTLNSPIPSGVFRLENAGESRKIYVGIYFSFLLALGLGAFLRERFRRKDEAPAPMLTVVLLLLAIAGVVFLATGPRNPVGPRAWELLMAAVPPYSMIRQTHKVYCLMPVLLALAAGLLFPWLLRGLSLGARRAAFIALLVPLLFEYSLRIRPTVCVLANEQGAFRAIADDAEEEGNPKPILLSLPLWPGESHYDSLNEHYVSLYRLRMVNGYGGSVKKWFWEDVVLPFESLNAGGIADAQLDGLLKRGVGYVVLHEDCFPEKVSPFPVGHTLQALLNCPRLACVGKDKTVWAFKILRAQDAEAGREKVAFMTHRFPAKRREFERNALGGGADVREEAAAVSGAYVALAKPGAAVRLSELMTVMDLPPVWLVRARGAGTVAVSAIVDGVTNAPSILEVRSDEWAWQRVPVAPDGVPRALGMRFAWESGTVDLDSASLTAGSWAGPEPGQSLELPAACFFHAGYTERDFRTVVLRRDHDPAEVIFYGPRLPLDAGRYTAELVFRSDAQSGTELGRLGVRWLGSSDSPVSVPVVAGQRAEVGFSQVDNKPVSMEFHFAREADIGIERVVISRVE